MKPATDAGSWVQAQLKVQNLKTNPPPTAQKHHRELALQKEKLKFAPFHFLPSCELLRKSPEAPLSQMCRSCESTNLGIETQLSPSAPSYRELTSSGDTQRGAGRKWTLRQQRQGMPMRNENTKQTPSAVSVPGWSSRCCWIKRQPDSPITESSCDKQV